MFKKIITLLAAGIIGCTAASCEKEITKEVPAVVEIKKEVPSVVTLENVHYYEHNNDGPICLYKTDGDNHGSLDSDGFFALSADIRIKDPNGVLYHKSEWGRFRARKPKVSTERKKELTTSWSIKALKKVYEKTPLTVEVADYRGNVTKHEFPLDEMIKQSKPFAVKEKVGGVCATNGDTPATVILENVYFHESQSDEPLCYYNPVKKYNCAGSSGKGSFGLSLHIKIQDPDGILYNKSDWEGWDSRPWVSKEKETETTSTLNMAGPSTGIDYFKKHPYIVEVADRKGNVAIHKFTWEDILKEAKPFIVKKQVGEDCPRLTK